MIGKAVARHGSITISSPEANCAHVELAGRRALLRAVRLAVDHHAEHVPQMPSRQSWSNTIGFLAAPR